MPLFDFEIAQMDIEKLLISEVRNHPMLYDSNNADYNDKKKKKEVWKAISCKLIGGDDLNVSVSALKTRWKSLRYSYVKERRYDTAKTTGVEFKLKKPWRLKSEMDFIAPYIQTKKDIPQKNMSDSRPSLNLVKEKKSNNASSVAENCSKMKKNVFNQNIQNADQDDLIEIDSFFRGIADAVKGLTRKNQLLVQKELTNMVVDYKLRELEEDENKSIRGQ